MRDQGFLMYHHTDQTQYCTAHLCSPGDQGKVKHVLSGARQLGNKHPSTDEEEEGVCSERKP